MYGHVLPALNLVRHGRHDSIAKKNFDVQFENVFSCLKLKQPMHRDLSVAYIFGVKG